MTSTLAIPIDVIDATGPDVIVVPEETTPAPTMAVAPIGPETGTDPAALQVRMVNGYPVLLISPADDVYPDRAEEYGQLWNVRYVLTGAETTFRIRPTAPISTQHTVADAINAMVSTYQAETRRLRDTIGSLDEQISQGKDDLRQLIVDHYNECHGTCLPGHNAMLDRFGLDRIEEEHNVSVRITVYANVTAADSADAREALRDAVRSAVDDYVAGDNIDDVSVELGH